MNGRAIGRWSIVAAAVLVWTSVHAAAAASDSVRRTSPWVYPGVVEMRLGQAIYRITRFDNDELLAEQMVDGKTLRMLRALPADRELFFGLSEAELPSEKNPFMFFDLTFAAALLPLDQAFPEGPSTVPVAAVTHEGVADRKHYVLVTGRDEAGRIGYRVSWDGLDEPVCGVIAIERPPAWPGPRPIADWQTGEGVRFDVLERARARP